MPLGRSSVVAISGVERNHFLARVRAGGHNRMCIFEIYVFLPSMKAKDKNHSVQGANCYEPVYYDGSFMDFASQLLSIGRGDGSVCRVCALPYDIAEDMRLRGIGLSCSDIIVTQRQIFKYRNHPKSAKGAVVSVSDYGKIETALLNPPQLYVDDSKRDTAYIVAAPSSGGRLLKIVVQPNYKIHSWTCNVAKSCGWVHESDMLGTQYRRIR